MQRGTDDLMPITTEKEIRIEERTANAVETDRGVDLPWWSGSASIVLLVAVIFFEHPTPAKYGLLFISQLLYLASVLRR